MLKLNIGFNRKIGEANYGSRGASVNLEIEVESGVVREPDKLQAKIGYLFELAKASVDAQLNGVSQPQQPAPATGNSGNGAYTNASANSGQSDPAARCNLAGPTQHAARHDGEGGRRGGELEKLPAGGPAARD